MYRKGTVGVTKERTEAISRTAQNTPRIRQSVWNDHGRVGKGNRRIQVSSLFLHTTKLGEIEWTWIDLFTRLGFIWSYSSKRDGTTSTSLKARRIRLLAYLAFIYPINTKNGKLSICDQVLPEEQLRSREWLFDYKKTEGQLKDLDIPSVNAALGYLARVVLLLSKYFMVGFFSISQQFHC